MADESDRGSANHEPSANRLQRAIEHGMVPYSAQLAASLQWLGGVLALLILVGWTAQSLGDVTIEQWGGAALEPFAYQGWLSGAAVKLLVMVALFLAVQFLIAIGTHGLQKGFKIPQRQHFDLYQMMPFGRKQQTGWGERFWVWGLRTMQLLIVLAMTYFYLRHSGWKIVQLWGASGEDFPRLIQEIVLQFGMLIGGSLLAVSLIDYGWQWYAHRLRLRMTDAELREENRVEEGNPHVRTHRQNRQRELARRR